MLDGRDRDTKVYLILAVLIIIVIVLTVFFSNSNLNPAEIPYKYRYGQWYEDIDERDTGSRLLGLENWCSFTYRLQNDTYPAYVTVTTFKTLFTRSEKELIGETKGAIVEKASEQGIEIDQSNIIEGERKIKNGHSTMYTVLSGNDTITGNITEKVLFLGETWNCGRSGTSVICIGYSQITDNLHNHGINISFWEKIVSDPFATFEKTVNNPDKRYDFRGEDGLIFNVKCH